MQAAGEFKALVGIGLYSSVISIVLTLALPADLGTDRVPVAAFSPAKSSSSSG